MNQQPIYVITYYSGGEEGWTLLIWAGMNLKEALKKFEELQEIARTNFEWYCDFVGFPRTCSFRWALNKPWLPEYQRKDKIFREFLKRCDPEWLLPHWNMCDEDKSGNFTLYRFDGLQFIQLIFVEGSDAS